MKRSASKSLLTSLWAQSVSRASSRAVAGSSTQLAQTFVPTSQYDQFRKYYHTSASNCNSIANAPRQSPQQSSQQALNRSTTAIRDNLLLLLTPAKKDQINLQSVLYDLQEITDASLVSEI